MTKGEVFETLKKMFIEHFGVGTEVELDEPIEISRSWDVGGAYIEKVRYNGENFEYYLNFWDGGWKDDKSVFNKYGVKVLSACLDVRVLTRTEYFID